MDAQAALAACALVIAEQKATITQLEAQLAAAQEEKP